MAKLTPGGISVPDDNELVENERRAKIEQYDADYAREVTTKSREQYRRDRAAAELAATLPFAKPVKKTTTRKTPAKTSARKR